MVDYVNKSPMQIFHDAMVVVWTSPLSAKWLHRIPQQLVFHHIEDGDNVLSWVPDLSRQQVLHLAEHGGLGDSSPP